MLHSHRAKLTGLVGGCSAVTENTRASYPINYIDNARIPCVGPHPKNLILLCCDAFGVLPPISRLTKGAGHVPLHLWLHGKGTCFVCWGPFSADIKNLDTEPDC